MEPDTAARGAVEGQRQSALRMEAREFRELGHALVDAVASLLERLPEGPLVRDASPADIRLALGAARGLPEEGRPARELLATATQLLSEHSLFNGHPRFFGYITSSPAPIGMLGDFLAAAVNANVGAWRLAPMASEIEAQSVRWIAELIGYPRDCGGLFVSGGNMANMVGLLVARAAGADWDVRAQGVAAAGARPLRVYASQETHTWIQKAVDLAGWARTRCAGSRRMCRSGSTRTRCARRWRRTWRPGIGRCWWWARRGR